MGLLNRKGAKLRARERGRLRRRLRELDELREEGLRDLGGLALEMYKRDRYEPQLLIDAAAGLAALDEESKELRQTLDQRAAVGVSPPADAGKSGIGRPAEPRPR